MGSDTLHDSDFPLSPSIPSTSSTYPSTPLALDPMPPTLTPAQASPEAAAQLGLTYRYLAPPPAAEAPPLALLLHGMGGDERVMWVFSAQLPPHWLQVAPRAPLPAQPAGWAWLPRRPDEWPELARFAEAVALLEGFLLGLPAWHRVDLSRIVLVGFSQGAATAFALALRLAGRGQAGLSTGPLGEAIAAGRPGPAPIPTPALAPSPFSSASPSPTLQGPRLCGLASLVGFMPEGAVAAGAAAAGEPPTDRPLAGLPTFVALGERDPLVPARRARQAADDARALGAAVSQHAYEAGHKLPLQGLRDLGAWCRGLGI